MTKGRGRIRKPFARGDPRRPPADDLNPGESEYRLRDVDDEEAGEV